MTPVELAWRRTREHLKWKIEDNFTSMEIRKVIGEVLDIMRWELENAQREAKGGPKLA